LLIRGAIRSKSSEQLISLDVQNSTTNYKSTYSVEIIPICKDDLICLPLKLARSLSNIGQLVLCARVGNSLHLMDPITLETAEMSAPQYWRAPFATLATSAQTTEFVVLDIEPAHHPPRTSHKGKFLLADAQVTPAAGSMDSDTIYHTRTHLGTVLKPGDTVLGYHLSSANYNNDAWDNLNASRVPEVILVRKTYPNRKKKSKGRNWKLKSIVKEAGDEHVGLGRERQAGGRQRGADNAKAEADYEAFLRDLEEDEEMRAGVNLWKAPAAKRAEDEMDVEESEAGDDEELPKIKLDELLDDMQELQLEDAEAGNDAAFGE
jgi:nonsense-mediated mRNA decay protein 3